jgi:DnaJ-domain-containing protein 1
MKSYEDACEKLKQKAVKQHNAILNKYKNVMPQYGLDGDPASKDLKKHAEWITREFKKLQKKYHKE